MTAGPARGAAPPPEPGAVDALPRRLGVWSAAAVLVGSTIGSGIFRVPSSVAGHVTSVGALAALWITGAVVTLFGALTIAELATMFPRSGGIYVYLREAYGPLPAFLFGWTRLLVVQPAVLGAVALIFGTYAGGLFGLDGGQIRLTAAGAIVLLAAVNYRSVAWVAAVQNVMTGAKVLALVGLAAVGFAVGQWHDAAPGSAPVGGVVATPSAGGVGVALIAILWTYDGWADLTYVAGEVRNPARSLPRALFGGVLAVSAVYLVVNAAFLALLSIPELAASPNVAAAAATRAFGPLGAAVAAVLVMVSTFGALNGMVMTGPRILFAMARDGLFFRRIGAVHPRFQTPHAAIALAALLGIGYLSVRTFEQLAEAFILGIWPFYVLAVLGVFILRVRRPDLPRTYRTLGYPVVPALFLLASSAMLANALRTQPGPTLFGFGVILAGIPAYHLWRRL